MRTPKPIPPDLPAVFTVAQAAQAGMGEWRRRGRDLVRPYRGLRMRGPLESTSIDAAERIAARAIAYAPRMADDQAFCSVTALALHGVALPMRLGSEPLHVTTPIDRARPVMPGVVGHRFAGVPVVRARGLVVSAPVPSWVQAATRLTVDELVEVGDALVRRVSPLAEVDELHRAVATAGRRRGVSSLRAALALVRPRTDSPPETRIRLIIVRAGLPEPEVNAPIHDRHGVFLGFGDLAYPELRIVIEHDGEHHFTSAAQGRHDIDRLASFARSGWIVIRAHRGTVRDPAVFLTDLAASIRARSPR